jgi:hypothetical protein
MRAHSIGRPVARTGRIGLVVLVPPAGGDAVLAAEPEIVT